MAQQGPWRQSPELSPSTKPALPAVVEDSSRRNAETQKRCCSYRSSRLRSSADQRNIQLVANPSAATPVQPSMFRPIQLTPDIFISERDATSFATNLAPCATHRSGIAAASNRSWRAKRSLSCSFCNAVGEQLKQHACCDRFLKHLILFSLSVLLASSRQLSRRNRRNPAEDSKVQVTLSC